MPAQFRIRVATAEDVPVLRELIDLSVRGLQSSDYTTKQIDSALRTVFGVDSQLISDGTHLVAEAVINESPVIVGCGGWSMRKTLYGGDGYKDRQDDFLDPRHDAAKIRSFFIHPDWARHGVGSMILDACEAAARAAGFTRFEMAATLTGVKLFRKRGYVALEQIDLPLENGLFLRVVRMSKQA
jgi:N-acetylglutamate synthase-like GNAT family acetyltransferase